MIFINMKNHFTSGFEKYRHKHYYILAALTVSMFWSDNIALTSISLINIDTPRDIDGFNVLLFFFLFFFFLFFFFFFGEY